MKMGPKPRPSARRGLICQPMLFCRLLSSGCSPNRSAQTSRMICKPQLRLLERPGKMMAALLFGLAEIEQETRREGQRVGIEAAKEIGKPRTSTMQSLLLVVPLDCEATCQVVSFMRFNSRNRVRLLAYERSSDRWPRNHWRLCDA